METSPDDARLADPNEEAGEGGESQDSGGESLEGDKAGEAEAPVGP